MYNVLNKNCILNKYYFYNTYILNKIILNASLKDIINLCNSYIQILMYELIITTLCSLKKITTE